MVNQEIQTVENGGTIAFITSDEKFALAVLSIQTDEEAKAFLDEFKEASKVVRQLKRLAHLRKTVVIRENQTLIELYRKGFAESIKAVYGPSSVAACKWATGLDENELMKIVYDGERTIRALYRDHKAEENERKRREQYFESCHYVRQRVLEDFSKDGKVVISADRMRSLVSVPKSVSDSDFHDFLDGTKDALLKAGAYGVGKGEYVRIENHTDLDHAITLRLKSITADMHSLLRIIDDCAERGIKMPPLILEGENNVNRNLNDYSEIYLLLLLNPLVRQRLRWAFATDKVAEYLRYNIDCIFKYACDSPCEATQEVMK